MSMKVVVIGTGFGKYAMAPAYEAVGGTVDLIPPRDFDAAKKAIEAGCDLVSVHTPPFLHLHYVKLATDNGCDVLCDKPFGRNAAESREMLDLATSAGVLHFLNFEFRFDPLRQKVKELIDAGAIGTPHHLASSMYISRGRNVPHGWLFEKDKGGGWIGAYASHHVDMLHWLFGEIAVVSSQPRIDVDTRKDRDPNNTQMHAATAEDAVSGWFRMKNGVTSSLDTAFSAATDLPPQFAVLGSEGVIQLSHGVDVVVHRTGRQPEKVATAAGDNAMHMALVSWLTRVRDAVQSRQLIEPNFRQGLQCAHILDAMRGDGGSGAGAL